MLDQAPTSTAIAVYLRVSSDEQRERQSIETQREAADRFLLQHGLRAHAVYADDGISGTIPLEQRPEGARLLADAQAGKFGVLLLYKLNRLGRDALVILQAIDLFQRSGIEIRAITQNLDL